jgi:hypothetical protein
MVWRGFPALHRRVGQARVRLNEVNPMAHAAQINHAVDLACVFYPKRVLCLQRSAATALLLRRHGIHAELVIGAQMMPFKSHAWVEVDGVVANDKPYLHDIYQVLERC